MRSASRAGAGIGGDRPRERCGEALRGPGLPVRARGGERVQFFLEAAQRFHGLGPGGRWRAIGGEGGPDELRHLLDDAELVFLVVGDEARQGPGAVDLGKPRDPGGGRVGGLDRGGEMDERVCVAVAALHQLHHGPDRFALRVLEAERVEVEPYERRERGGCDQNDPGADDDAPGAAFDEAGDGLRETAFAAAHAVRPGVEHGDERGQQGHGREEADRHPGAGDEAELGEAQIGGRQEREEADPGGKRREREPGSDAGRGERGRVGAVDPAPRRLAPAESVMDAEIDAEPDEEHGEGDRDQVEHPDGRGRERRRPQQPDHKRQERRQ